jgi:hypothetical protein
MNMLFGAANNLMRFEAKNKNLSAKSLPEKGWRTNKIFFLGFSAFLN